MPWIGWAILLGTLQLTHVFAPINRHDATALLLHAESGGHSRGAIRIARDAPWLLIKREARNRFFLLHWQSHPCWHFSQFSTPALKK